MSHDDFQPPDQPEPDYDALWDSWFEAKEKNGYAVLTRDEWHTKLDEASTLAYAEGRAEEREELKSLLAWAYGKLAYRSFAEMDDCLRMDELKLLLMGAPV